MGNLGSSLPPSLPSFQPPPPKRRAGGWVGWLGGWLAERSAGLGWAGLGGAGRTTAVVPPTVLYIGQHPHIPHAAHRTGPCASSHFHISISLSPTSLSLLTEAKLDTHSLGREGLGGGGGEEEGE